MIIKRSIFNRLALELERPEISIILGPRQVGKTFLLKELENYAKEHELRTRYYNLELPHDLVEFNKKDTDLFEMLTSHLDVVFIDEFHYLPNASKLFKVIFDSSRKVKLYVSGSSSIEIHKHLKESLAGRRLVTRLMPLTFAEYVQTGSDLPELLAGYLTFGGLPGLTHQDTGDEKIRLLHEILETYIQKDIKSLIKEENIRAFNMLLYLIAERQGSVVSVAGLAGEIGLTPRTIEHHISLLEQTYVIYPVGSYSRNIGNELKKSRKFYFYDIGIRNSLLRDFGPLEKRSDAGALHESFAALQLTACLKPNMELKFWRNKAGHEIDFVLLKDRTPFLIEVKTTLRAPEIPPAMKIFIKHYPETPGAVVLSQNLEYETDYLGKKILFRKLTALAEVDSICNRLVHLPSDGKA
ncbi:MAG: ATP-binding protein [Nitrospirae bacterium]|nr:ATP-binding protein [Nitrospirota bacterium]